MNNNPGTPDWEVLLWPALKVSLEAGAAIMEVFRSDFEVEHKADSSPVTIADRRAHDLISAALVPLNFPVLSEEGIDIPYEERKGWDYYWLVDPLDGTKEFVRGLENFTVNIALMHREAPLMGIIYVPAKHDLYYNIPGKGAYKVSDIQHGAAVPQTFAELQQRAKRLPLSVEKEHYVVATSQSHRSGDADRFLAQVREHYPEAEIWYLGSAVKLCLVAEGSADIFPRLGPTMEWDTAAGQALLEAVGKPLVHFETREALTYNKPNLGNPWFIAGSVPFD
ncbi:MAG: 3'(2'),5'-bisphosphate nucleotidase CysQ [Salibacteraceae bacterium]